MSRLSFESSRRDRRARKPLRSRPGLRSVEGLERRDLLAAFTPGDLVIYRVGDGIASLANTGNAVFLDEYSPTGTLVQSIALPTTTSGANHRLIASGTATSEGLLSLSADGKYLVLTGYDAAPGGSTSVVSTTAAAVNRVIGRVDSKGAVDTTTALTDSALDANNPRSATSTDGTNLWFGGATGGVRYATLGATTSTQLSTTVTNIRQVNVFNGQLYESDSSGSTIRLGAVGTGTPTTSGQTITNLPGFPTSTGSPYAFFFADLSPSVAGVDTVYVADDGGSGGIQKYSLNGTTWSLKGTITAASVRGLTGSVSGTNVSLYGTTGGSAATGGGSLYAFTDTTGFGNTVSGAATTIATATTNEAFRGIAFAPTSGVVVNQPPTANADSYSTAEDTALNIAAPGVLGNDTDPENDALTAVIVAGPAHAASFTLNADGSFSYTPAANYNGPDSFTYKAKDGSNNLSGTATVSLTINAVNDAPTISVPAAQTVSQDSGLTFSGANAITVADIDAATGAEQLSLSVAHGTLTLGSMTGLSVVSGSNGSAAITVSGQVADLNAALNGLSYTPAAGYNGPDSLVLHLDDQGNSGSGGPLTADATVAITVTHVNHAPVAVADSYATAKDTTLTVSAPGVLGNDTDADSDTLTAAVVADPAHGTLTLNPDGSLTYTPVAGYVGGDSFTYKANDGTADSNTATVSIDVTATDAAPVANDDSYATDEDTTLTVSAPGVLGNDTDADSDTLTATLVAGPAHAAAFTLNADGSFSYTPAANYNGPDSFTYRAGDGTLNSGVATVNLTVNPVNDVPVAANDAYTIDEDETLVVAAPGVLGNDTDADSDALTAVLVDGPSHGTLTLRANGSFGYVPFADYNGPDSFTYTANDGTANSNTATVSITVNAVNDAPVTNDDSYSTGEDATLTVAAPGVLGNDTDVEGDTLTASVVTGPSHGTLTLNPDGSFSYVPAANYNGPDSFTYKANDGAADSGVATVSLTVNPVNDAPTASPQSLVFGDDGEITITLQGSDPETSADDLTFTITLLPDQGTLLKDGTPVTVGQSFVGSPTGLVYRMPTVTFGAMSTSFTFTVRDTGDPAGSASNALTSAPATVTIQTPAGSDGVVRIGGTDGADSIAVTHTSGGNLQVTVNGSVVSSTIPLSSVTAIRVFGRGGDDTLRLSDVVKPTVLSGGAGQDLIYIDGTSGADIFALGTTSGTFNGAALSYDSTLLVSGLGGNDVFTVTASGVAATLVGGDGDETVSFSDGASVTGTIDGGAGNNTLSYAAYTGAVSVNLAAGTATGTLAISNFANATGGSENDLLVGNALANLLDGRDGNDTLLGGDGNDVLLGGNGDDVLSGGNGVNSLFGNVGNDRVQETANANFTLTGASLVAGSVNDSLSSLEAADLTGGAGNNTFTVSAWSGTGSITGNGGSDTVVATKDADFTLSDGSLTASDGLALSLSGVGTANLTGGASANTFTVGGWSGKGKIVGGGGTDTINATHEGNFTLSNTSLKFGTATLTLSSIEAANLAGDSGSSTFTVGGWSGTGSISGGGGSDTVVASKNVASGVGFVLTDSSLTATDGLSLALTNVGTANLTGGTGNDTFDVSGWTGKGKIAGGAGSDTIVDNVAGSTGRTITLTKTALTVSGGQSLTIAAIEAGRLSGGSGNDTLNASAFLGQVTLAGGAGNDLLTGGAGADVLLGGDGLDSLNGGAGRDILVGGAGADSLNGGNGDDILIGGSVSYGDTNYAAFDAILAEWTSADDYATRISKIQSGSIAGGYKLDSSTVLDDAAVDLLIGGTATTSADPTNRDWFLARTTGGSADNVSDAQGDETVTSI